MHTLSRTTYHAETGLITVELFFQDGKPYTKAVFELTESAEEFRSNWFQLQEEVFQCGDYVEVGGFSSMEKPPLPESATA